MKARKRKLTDDEIEAEVLSQLHDPRAWDQPIYVPPSNSPRPTWVTLGRHLELSARFHVLSVLHRLGAEANLTLAHPDNVDITVVHTSGRAITIDVKALIGTSKWFLEPFSARTHHYLAFVLFPRNAADPAASPEVVVLPSERLQAFLKRHKANPINIQSLPKELKIESPWRQLLPEAA